MEIKLPIYNKREIVKTYTAETYDIMFGTIEDLIDVLDVEKLSSGKDEDLVKCVVMAVPKTLHFVKPLLKDIFDGLTDDELKNCKVSDIANVLVKVIKFAIAQIADGAKSKN